MARAIIESPLGNILIEGDRIGISKIYFSEESIDATAGIPHELADTVFQLKEYFLGNLKEFKLKPNPSGSAFQQKVWKALGEIPYGKTLSYLDLSKKLGDTKAIRAVAAANGKNPLSIVVPCHRVVGSDGSLTGYAGGLWRKKWLLAHESPVKQQELF